MAYWGYKTPANFAMWMVITVCIITGVIWMPIGGAGIGWCSHCADQLGPRLNVSGVDKGCNLAAFSFRLYEPVLAAKMDSKEDFYWSCVNGGPIAAITGGTVVLGAGLLMLIYFCVVKPPAVQQ